MLKPNSTVPSTNGSSYQQLVTDGEGNVKWEDRLAYETYLWKDYILNSNLTSIKNFTMPPVGETVAVKVNGVESIEVVKSAEFEGEPYSYIGSVDIMGLMAGTEGWFIGTPNITGSANPETTVSLMVLEPHKIDEKYLDMAFVRTLSYYIEHISLYKSFYSESGEKVLAYKCGNLIIPPVNAVFIYDIADIGIGSCSSKRLYSFFVNAYIFQGGSTSEGVVSSFKRVNFIFGTDENDMTELAASKGYTLTTKPTT